MTDQKFYLIVGEDQTETINLLKKNGIDVKTKKNPQAGNPEYAQQNAIVRIPFGLKNHEDAPRVTEILDDKNLTWTYYAKVEKQNE